jgi:hypothetical protein
MADPQRPLIRPVGPQPAGPRSGDLQGDDRHAGFRQVECDRCGAAVLVAKFSLQHTSVQWDSASLRACAEFSPKAAAGEQTALIDTCASLRDSIQEAVRSDRLRVSPP